MEIASDQVMLEISIAVIYEHNPIPKLRFVLLRFTWVLHVAVEPCQI